RARCKRWRGLGYWREPVCDRGTTAVAWPEAARAGVGFMSAFDEEAPRPRRKPEGRSRPPEPSPTDPDEPTTFRRNSKPKARGESSRGRGRELDPGKAPTFWERIVFGRVGSGQLAAFCRQFSAYLNAGVDIGKALTNLQTQFAMTALGP